MAVPTTSVSRERSLYLAQLAEQAERFDDMIVHITSVAREHGGGTPLDAEERNLLSIAFKQQVGQRRASHRCLGSILSSEMAKGNAEQAEICKTYQDGVTMELKKLVADIHNLLDETLLPSVSDDSTAKVFYLKMKADYFRYATEFISGDDKALASDGALSSYQEAWELACSSMGPGDADRLGLALNFSVFHYETLDQPEEAISLATGALDDAMPALDDLSEDSFEDSGFIVQLLRDNLTLWGTLPSGGGDDDESEECEEDNTN